MPELLLHISHSVWWEGRGLGEVFGPLLPLSADTLGAADGPRGSGCHPSAVRGGDTALAACQKGFISASHGSTRSPSVLHDPQHWGQSTAVAEELGAPCCRREVGWRDSPLVLSEGPAGFSSVSLPFAPACGSGLAHSYPFTSAHQETQGLKSVGPEGLKEKISFAE